MDISQGIFTLARAQASGAELLGTAFMAGPQHLVTALHVTGGTDQNLVAVVPRIAALGDYQDTTSTDVKYAPVEIAQADPVRDLCVLKVPAASGWGFNYRFGSTDETPPGTPVTTYGFPHADFGRMVLTRQDATVGARVLVGAHGLKNKHLVLNVQARPGQSGGPVFTRDGSAVVAVLIGSYAPGGGGGISLGGVDPATLHATTHAVSAEYLNGMLS